MNGESGSKVADPHVGEAGDCATPGCVDAATGCGLYEGTLGVTPHTVEGTGSGLSIGCRRRS
jgi:hypothetical protein